MHASERIFGPDGLLSEHLNGYEMRPQQLKMARHVSDAFADERRLVVEAATGTGKTLSYLVPAILSGQRVIVSTATKALQEQIFYKDIPFLKALFKKDKPRRAFQAITMKGRSNYLCKLRYEQFSVHQTFRNRREAGLFGRVRRWARTTKSGDRATIKGLPDDFEPWQHVTATGQQCVGSDCRFYEDCFVTKLRREAREADVIVVNHHLFFADLALRGTGVAEVLPEYDAVIFDEAHHLEHIVTSFFGLQLSNYRVTELLSDLRRDLDTEDALTLKGLNHIDEVERYAALFFESFAVSDGRHDLEEVLAGGGGPETLKRAQLFLDALGDLMDWVETADAGEIARRLHERCEDMSEDLEEILSLERASMVYIVERRGRGVFLEASPIDVAALFRRRVLSQPGTQIYTSATLTAGGSFDYFLDRLGMNERPDIDTLTLPPVFDYEERALTYIPRRLPQPTHPRYLDGVCQIVEYLVKTTEGRAFILFTSYRNMDHVFNELSEKFAEDYTVLKQGEMPRHEMLQLFREDTNSVLFGTSSFWEGVDVEGESLSLVIIDKLPFVSPVDPLNKARVRLLESQGKNPFASFFVPSAAIALRQGFGRLIRSRRDQGIVAILDSRIASKGYGRTFLDSLPPAPVVWNAREVRAWWRQRQESLDASHGAPPSST